MSRENIKERKRRETEEFNKRVGVNLRKLREKKGWTQEYMVEALKKTHQSDYARLEQGVRKLTFEDAVKIAALLDEPVEKIFNPNETDSLTVSDIDREAYGQPKRKTVQMMVSLDGDGISLEKQVHLLRSINELLLLENT